MSKNDISPGGRCSQPQTAITHIRAIKPSKVVRLNDTLAPKEQQRKIGMAVMGA